MHRIVCKVSNRLKRQCNPSGIESEMYYSQYDQDEEFERLGVPFRILPGTDEFSRIERRALNTKNISIYTIKVSELAQERIPRSSLTSGKLLYQRAWTFTK